MTCLQRIQEYFEDFEFIAPFRWTALANVSPLGSAATKIYVGILLAVPNCGVVEHAVSDTASSAWVT